MACTAHVLDLGGQPATTGWTRTERAQNALTNLQQTGQLRGVLKRTFAVEPEEAPKKVDPLADPSAVAAAPAPKPLPVRDVTVELSGAVLRIRTGARLATIALDEPGAPVPAWIRTETPELSQPGNVTTWAVDRVRNVVGDDAMQYVKYVAFTALDYVMSKKESVTGDTGAEDIAKDLGKSELDPPMRAIPSDPEIGWPPPPLEPWVVPALPGEGQWNPLDKDPFVRTNPGLPPAFLTTFVRTDRARKATRTYIALWDPRQIELHMMAGTVEPKGATGEAGPGLIPRTPEVLKRVVAASNAGFQALHGEFGMMADGVVYLPPKPYAATVAVLRDGSTGFGSWPADTTIPEPILSYRQNMTVMVQDEKFNPFNRTWWGGTPPGWADKTHTVRTGICLTKERFIAYFYGADLSPEALAQAMIQARCAFGLALDMNAGHSGLEFYKIAPCRAVRAAQAAAPGRLAARGRGAGARRVEVPRPPAHPRDGAHELPSLHQARGARLLLHDPAPRAAGAGAHARDPEAPARGRGRVAAQGPAPARLPVRARAHRAARGRGAAGLQGEGAPDRSPDRHRHRGVRQGGRAGKTVAVLDAGEKPSGEVPSLWHSAGAFSIAPAAPVPDAVRLASGEAPGKAGVAALGVSDEGGMLYYLEVEADGPLPRPPTARSSTSS